ncbi:MAG: hypothetical protein IKW45_03870 [Clostridia bacterium]|nr:hypothetical protein [Clostridia bacterium]
MSVVKQLEILKSWLETEICPDFKFKPANDDNVDETYPYALVEPNVFILYVPPAELLNGEKRAPSICVQFTDASENSTEAVGTIDVALQFATFNPGVHVNYNSIHDVNEFTRNVEGWRDVWNLVDRVMWKIRNTEVINGLRITKEKGVKCAPAKDNGAIPLYYPYYFATVTFTAEYGLAQPKEEIRHLL